ncbi:hypothetical protein J2W45_001406 [Leifsonia shinshuensis]|nr:hypothetical protein [Leifsonia shinshuensis]
MNAAARRLMAVHAHPDDESSMGVETEMPETDLFAGVMAE